MPDAATPSAPTASTIGVLALCGGGIAVSLSQTMVIPVQSALPRLLSTSPADAAWVITVTLLCGAVAMPVAGRLADLWGKWPVLVGCLGLLAVGSVVCGVAETLAPMLVGRGLQGAAMGFIPVGIALLREVSAPGAGATAVAAMSASLGVGSAIGLPLGAWIVDTGQWHGLFWVTAAIAAVAVVVVALVVPRVPPRAVGRLDLSGALLLAVGLVVFLLGVTRAASWGWLSLRTGVVVAVGVALLVLWGLHQLHRLDPLIDLRASARRPVALANVAAVVIGFGLLTQAIVMPQLLQVPESAGHGLGTSMLAAGLWMAPGGLTMLVVAPLSSALITRVGPRDALVAGALVLAAGYGLVLLLADHAWQVALASCVTSAGVAVAYAAMPTLIMDAVTEDRTASAVGFNALMRCIGTTSAAAVMGTILASWTTAGPAGSAVPTAAAFTTCFAIGGAAALLAAGVAACAPGRKAATPATSAAPAVRQVPAAQRA
ncbi:MFS transporter [Nocardioides zeae]|uniref:MFS transporter n=1 Tax=Nocardioides imazamoxiresistens TaxID=3231893 RepID=A0ABU3PSH8_9ACTN|nr:MFS transporter [Nocardioides zeae]MDT9592178.1 MFS transporter [Nocardioides zeae]